MSEINEESVVDKVLGAILDKITTPEERSKYLKVLIYGSPGVGKTVFSATAPHPLLVDIEKGAGSIQNHPQLSHVAVYPFKSIAGLETVIKYLAAKTPELEQYETIIIDSFSELQKRDLDETVAHFAKLDSSRNKYLPIGTDYNINTEHMRQIASSLRDLDRHLVVTCSVKEEKNDATGQLLVRPNLTPKLAGTLAGIFDIVGYMDISPHGNDNIHTLQVHPSPTITAKTRVGGLPAVIENPTFSDLLNAFKKGN